MLFNIPPLERAPMYRTDIYVETVRRRVISKVLMIYYLFSKILNLFP
jgi:hypothetical protein